MRDALSHVITRFVGGRVGLDVQRPMVLTKYADGNMHPGLVQHQHPAQHRYPVWWTGDGVSLEASVESMVDSGVYDFKPFVHR